MEGLKNNDLASIASSILSPLIRDWSKQNQHIDTNILAAHLTTATLEFGTNFTTKLITIPTWNIINKKAGKGFHW